MKVECCFVVVESTDQMVGFFVHIFTGAVLLVLSKKLCASLGCFTVNRKGEAAASF